MFEAILGQGKKTFIAAGVAILAIAGAYFAPKFLPVSDTVAATAAVQVCVAGASTLPEATPEEIQIKADASAKCQEIDDKPITPMSAVLFGLGFLSIIFLRQAMANLKKSTDAAAAAAKPPGS